MTFIKGQIAWNKGLKGKQPWHDMSGLGKNIDFKKRGESISKAMTGMKRPDEYKKVRARLMKNKWADPEYRKMIMKSRIGKYDSDEQRRNGIKGFLKVQNRKGFTSIEKALYDHLLLKGILFEKQYIVNGKFIVDAYIPSLNLVIEADGKYWHSLPQQVIRDKSRDAYFKKCGLNLLRLSEQEINSGDFKERMVF